MAVILGRVSIYLALAILVVLVPFTLTQFQFGGLARIRERFSFATEVRSLDGRVLYASPDVDPDGVLRAQGVRPFTRRDYASDGFRQATQIGTVLTTAFTLSEEVVPVNLSGGRSARRWGVDLAHRTLCLLTVEGVKDNQPAHCVELRGAVMLRPALDATPGREPVCTVC